MSIHNPDDIIKKVIDHIGYDINYHSRERIYCEPKQIIAYLLNTLLKISPPDIAIKLGVKRSGTYHSIKTIDSLLIDKIFIKKYGKLFEHFGINI